MDENFFKGELGLEKESLRVDAYGFLPKTKHPFPNHPNIERDFCENQIEIITDVFYSIPEVYQQLLSIQQFILKELANLNTGPEFLWPFSNPPYIRNEDDIHIATYSNHWKTKEEYRKYLAKKYGKRKMLFSGIHFNFSFESTFLESQFKSSAYESFFEYKNQLYLNLAKKITQYAWLLVYLTSASPVADGSLINDESIGKDLKGEYASFRCSEIGYWNSFVPILNYSSLKDYINSIQVYIQNGKLKFLSELYYPVRLKTKGENSLERLLTDGINHIELRMFDLNPLDPAGIKELDLTFVYYFIFYLTQLPEIDFGREEQVIAIENE
ncbi:glutathione synthase, partial [Anaerostipes sp.]|uniref:glutathione synthase n=1 Tax=Anaerostipes sp. TaxID=1872530 RepID=UPI0025862E08